MTSLWWFALPVLLLPLWWHRQKRQRADAQPLATARFLPRTDPKQQRIWRWADVILMVVRCLLLATVIVWLADIVLPWRGNSVLVAPGTDAVWRSAQVKEAGFADADLVAVPTHDVFAWLAKHEREWRSDARILVLGDVAMPALRPTVSHQVSVRSRQAVPAPAAQRVYIASKRAPQWQALFGAMDKPRRFTVSTTDPARADLIIWDVPEAPPPGLRAPLWWVGDATAFPELDKAPVHGGLRYADSARGRLWSNPAWPAANADAARAQFETWQRLHFAPLAYPTPPQPIAATGQLSQRPINGALRYFLMFALLALFVLERVLAHANRR